jgi:hypothetical protein
MLEANPSTSPLLAALISGVLSGVIVALLNYWLTRKKLQAETKFIEVQAEKIRRELNLTVDGISAAVTYAASSERVIYDSTGRELGFDFKGFKAQLWERIDGVDRPVSDYGLGQLSFDNGILNVQRSNMEGRYEIWLQSYIRDGQVLPAISPNDLISEQRRIRISFEAKVIGGSHTLRVLLKNEKANKWLGEESRIISANSWTSVKIYFQIPPTEECRLRIDDLDVSSAPSSLQIRNFIVAERAS